MTSTTKDVPAGSSTVEGDSQCTAASGAKAAGTPLARRQSCAMAPELLTKVQLSQVMPHSLA